MRISLLVPCFNEEKTLERSLASWLSQSRPFDEIIAVDDSSTDRTSDILKEHANSITIVRTARNSGNKSYAQELGLQFITGDVFATTDGDSLLHPDFAARLEEDFTDGRVAGVGGYVKSLTYNWITASRGLDYAVGQNLDKLAQNYLNFLFRQL